MEKEKNTNGGKWWHMDLTLTFLYYNSSTYKFMEDMNLSLP